MCVNIFVKLIFEEKLSARKIAKKQRECLEYP